MGRTHTCIVRDHDHRPRTEIAVVHTAEGATHARDLCHFFPSVQADAHSGIDADGECYHYVRLDEKAWHVANENGRAVGCELCGFAAWSTATWVSHFHKGMLRASLWYARVCLHYNLPVTRSRRRGICGHGDLGANGGGHTDPGPNFPWRYFLYLTRIQYYRMKGWNKSRNPARRAAFARYKRYCVRVQKRYGVRPDTTP